MSVRTNTGFNIIAMMDNAVPSAGPKNPVVIAPEAVGKTAAVAITESARQALLSMGQHRVSPTPQNYHVWYEHIRGGNDALSKAIEDRIRSGEPFSADFNIALYDGHIARGLKANEVRAAQEGTRELLHEFLKEILAANQAAAQYEQSLTGYSNELKSATRRSEVEELVKALIEETTKMALTSHDMKERLDEATQRAETLQQQLVHLQKEATTDPLTGLHNRKAIDGKLAQLIADFDAKAEPFSVVMLDIDHFKKFNDTYGHTIGDHIIKMVASALEGTEHAGAFAGRYGGEEFTLLLPKTGLASAGAVAERLRRAISDKRLKLAKSGKSVGQVTISAGVTEFAAGDCPESVVERADTALYQAKDGGRNNVKLLRK